MAGKFSLAEHIAKGVVPDLGTSGREQIEYIDIDSIDDAPSNFYELSGLDELAANIELLGLQQPIRVRPGEGQGRYVIVSGHRRRAAVRKLVEDGHGELRELPCIVEIGQGSAALQELRLIYANSDTRKMTSSDISRQAERVEALLYQLKEEGYEFPGRMRDHVAEACKVSKSKLARLKVIRENLAGPWKPAYESGELAESAAYTLAQMPAGRQQVIFDGLAAKGKAPGAAQEYMVKNYGENLALAEKVTCKKQGGPCTNLEAMRAHIMGLDSWSYSCCRQCCEECVELARCKHACPMLADKVKQLKADAKARKQQERQVQEEEIRLETAMYENLWKRFGEARAAAGKSLEEFFEAVDIDFSTDDVRDYEKAERLETGSGADLPYGFYMDVDDVHLLVASADLFGVSLDYLLCRTDDPAGFPPQPEGQLVFNGWMPGGTLPRTPCGVVADFDVGDGVIRRMVCEFSKGSFRFRNAGAAIEAVPVRWMMLPPVGEET